MSSLILTVRESIRYRGRSGQYSWLAHRISGLAILTFVVIHVWDTANAYFWPQAYVWSLALFKHPFFGLGEVGVMAAVLYHAFNGTRITLLDFKPEWWRHQRISAIIVWVIFFVVFIPVAILMLSGLIGHCQALAQIGDSCFRIPAFSEFAQYAR
ncbi:MAG: succinate dehydrogenase, cytochrome b556 subunit [Candidatus Promineofilum sp.]|nr:succinate dehydrogenase, cytochrome b556 subunit [Promineifilum sp.]MBP9656850.1 succinate dehydrogenase, cytochrome b556 subunit [Promineifilum sp.]